MIVNHSAASLLLNSMSVWSYYAGRLRRLSKPSLQLPNTAFLNAPVLAGFPPESFGYTDCLPPQRAY
jgi:hypothetical protein